MVGLSGRALPEAVVINILGGHLAQPLVGGFAMIVPGAGVGRRDLQFIGQLVFKKRGVDPQQAQAPGDGLVSAGVKLDVGPHDGLVHALLAL